MSHISLLLPDLEMGGAQRVMLLLAREFVMLGHRVDIILLSSSGPLLGNIPEGVNVVNLKPHSFGLGQFGFLLSSVFHLAARMNKKTPDILFSTITGANIVALLAQNRAKKSSRIVIREAVTLENITSKLRLRAMRWLYPQANAVIALTPVMASELSTKIGVPLANIHCIANPVDTEFIHEQSRIFITHPWLDDKRIKVIISVGRLILQKDYLTLLHAVSLLPRKLSVRLIIIGEGNERESLEKLAIKLAIDNISQFVGFDSNPWRWMARADLFVLSSRWEGYPNVLLEALTLGLPAIITKYDDSTKDMAKNHGVHLVDVGDEAMLAREIKNQLTSDTLIYKSKLPENNNSIVKAYLHALGIYK